MTPQVGDPHLQEYLLAQAANGNERLDKLEQQAINPAANTLTIGDGTQINRVMAGPIDLNPGSIGATSTGTVDFTIVGANPGDVLIMNRPNGLNDDLIFAGCRINAANTARVYLYNPTGGAIDDGNLTWTYCWLDVT